MGNCSKFKTLCFLLLLSVFSCEDNFETVTVDQTNIEILKEGSPYRVASFSMDEIPLISKQFKSRTGKDIQDSGKEDDALGGAIFNTENILQVIDTLKNTSYSFGFVYEETPLNVFYNLVMGTDANGQLIDPYVLRYESEWASYEKHGDRAFEYDNFMGKINLLRFTDFFDKSSFSGKDSCPKQLDAYGDTIPCATSSISSGGGSGGSGSSGTGSGGSSNGAAGGSGGSGGSNIHVSCGCPPRHGRGESCSCNTTVVNILKAPRTGPKSSKSGDSLCGGCDSSGTSAANPPARVVSLVDRWKTTLKITADQASFLLTRPTLVENLRALLGEHQLSPESKAATLITIETLRTGKLYGPYNSFYYKSINSYVDANLTDPATIAKWASHFAVQCAILKQENPSWSDTKVFWEASKEMVHLTLDIGGMVPVVGEVCDITNGVIYTIEGDGVNAALSYSAAIPIAGWFATGAKWAKKTINIASDISSKVSLKWIVKADGVIDFGQRSQLAKVLGTKGTGKHAHHIIPWAFKELPIVQKASKSKSAFHLNERLNGIPLQSTGHLTGHNKYNTKVNAILTNLNTLVGSNNDLAYKEIFKLTNYLDTLIKNNPNKNLGQIADLINY